jgi:branched-chain amino acid transport system substrate-binding protein
VNARKVPQLFVSTGATKWNDPQNFPWTMGWQPNYQDEARIYAKYILKEKPDARIAVLYQNDDFGKDYLKGLKDGLGDKAASLIVAEDAYDVTEPTIDSHIIKMKSLNASVFVDIAAPKFAAQAIRKTAEIGWKPLHLLTNVSVSVGVVMKPAGFEASQGIISSAYIKDPTDPQWKSDPGPKAWNEFLDKYYPEANRADAAIVYAYTVAQTLVHVLKACGDNLTRENVMKQAASIRDLELGALLPGIKINTSATDFAPISQVQMMRFKGETWERFGDILGSDIGG